MNLNFSEMTKEQKQYIVLGIIAVGAVGFGLYIGLSKIGSSMSTTKSELEQLNDKIDRAERELGRKSKTMEDFNQTITVLETHLENLPPIENYYSWATEIVYAKGRAAGLQIESVDEIGMDSKKSKGLTDPVYFETYSLRITARGGFEDVKSFIQDVEENHPLARFTGVEISRANDPEKHNVQLFVQWPHKLERITALWKDQYRRPAPMVAKSESRPEPKIVREAPKAEPKPEPAIAAKPEMKQPVSVVAVKSDPAPAPAPAPKPVPAPKVVKKDPTPPVSKPVKPVAPVVVAKPAPAPKPVVAKAEPKPIAKPAPKPVVRPAPVEKPEVVKPAPVVAKVEPIAQPAPVIKPDPVVVPKPEKPAPVVAHVEPTPVVEPEKSDHDHTASILASIDKLSEPEPKAEKPEADEMASLLASLDSHTDSQPEPKEESAPDVIQAQVEAEELSNYIQQLASTTPAQEEPVAEPISVPVVEPIVEQKAIEPVRYVSSGISAKILEELLIKDQPETSKSLSSFLDGMVGEYK